MERYGHGSGKVRRHSQRAGRRSGRLWLGALVACAMLSSCSQPRPRVIASKPTPINPATVGEIAGTIYFKGTPPRRQVIHMDEDPVCASEHRGRPVYAEDGKVNPNGTLPNVFVYLRAGAEKYVFAPPSRPVLLAQKGCMYVPHVLGIQVGQPLEIISEDPTMHNVHLIAKNNPEWNVSQGPGAPPIFKTFSRPEVMMSAECNQHPWMRCYIGAVANPFYAVTGSSGQYVLRGVPAGTYTVEAWTATFGSEEKSVTVRPKKTTQANFTFKPM